MLVKDLMTSAVVCCTPWDTAETAASLMKAHGVGAIAVVADPSDPLLEGIVTDRDLCCGVVAAGKNADAVQVADLMTRHSGDVWPGGHLGRVRRTDAGRPSSQNPRCEQSGTVHRHCGSSGHRTSRSCRASRKHNQGDFQTRETAPGNAFRERLFLLRTAA